MGLIGSVVGGVTSAVGSLHQTDAEKQMAQYQADQANINYHLIHQAAAAEAADIRSQTGQMVGAQEARTKGGGVTLEGTPLQVMADTAAAGELKAQRTLFAGKVAATGQADVMEMAKFNKYFLEWNRFNRAGSSFLSSFGSSGGFQQTSNVYQNYNTTGGRSLLGG